MLTRCVLPLTSVLIQSCLVLTTAKADLLLAFDSLPSTQGFSYIAQGVGSGLSEGDVFSVDGHSLTLDTLGSPTSGSGTNNYTILNIIDPATLIFSVEWTVRVFENEGPATFGNMGMGVEAHFGSNSIQIGMSANRLDVWDGDSRVSIAQDNTFFREYVAEAIPGLGWSLSVDGSQLYSNLGFRTTTTSNMLRFGDLTGLQNSRAELTHMELKTTAVPEPSSLIVLTLGICLQFGRRSRRAIHATQYTNDKPSDATERRNRAF